MTDENDQITQWEFIDKTPSRSEVIALLNRLDPVWGVRTVEFADYVQGLPSRKKTVIRDERGRKQEQYHEVVTLYMGVAGRLKMIEAAANRNDWRVDFEPEPVTPTGVPGFLQNDDRIVYREYVTIWAMGSNGEWQLLGRKPGMAWVPSKGGSQAAGSNPYEKVETSARGRALAAWGFGVLPGSGVASLEEMLGVSDNRAGMQQDRQEAQPTKTRDEMIAEIVTLNEEIRQAREIDPQEQATKLADYVKRTFGLEIAVEDTNEDGVPVIVDFDWSKVKDGQLMLTAGQLQQSLKKIRTEDARV